MAETFVKKIGDLLDINAGPGLIAGDELLVQSSDDSATYKTTVEAINNIGAQPFCAIQLGVEASIPDSTWTPLEFISPVGYTGSLSDWWDEADPERVLFGSASGGAVYEVTGQVKFESDGTGFRAVRINQSNASPIVDDSYLETYFAASSVNSTFVVFNFVVPEGTPTNYFQLEVYQNSGGVLPVFEFSTYMLIKRIK
jgi:hypothetical protein